MHHKNRSIQQNMSNGNAINDTRPFLIVVHYLSCTSSMTVDSLESVRIANRYVVWCNTDEFALRRLSTNMRIVLKRSLPNSLWTS